MTFGDFTEIVVYFIHAKYSEQNLTLTIIHDYIV